MTSYASYNDGELLSFLRNDDQLAFTEIYTRYIEDVYVYLFNYVKDPMHAEDLAHEVFAKLWEIRDRLTIQASFAAYLFRICHNMAISSMQKITAESKLLNAAAYHLRAISSSEIQASSALLKYDQMFDDALNSLPPQCRKVYILCRQQGKSYEETAAELGISRNTVKDHLIKASKMLRNFLVDKGEIAFALLILQHLF